jgi:hypothetical protein
MNVAEVLRAVRLAGRQRREGGQQHHSRER